MPSLHRKTPLWSLVCLLLAVGCGGSKANTAGTTPPTTTTDPATTTNGAAADKPPTMPLTGAPEDMLRLFEGLSAQIEAAGADCTKYAAAVKTWVGTNSARYKELHSKVHGMQLPAEEEQQFDSRLAEAMGVIVGAASSCGENDQAWAAFQSFDQLVEGS